ESLALHREVGDQHGMGLALRRLARVAYGEGERAATEAEGAQTDAAQPSVRHWSAAATQGAESLALLWQAGARRDVAPALELLAAVASRQGRAAAAARLCGAAEALREAIGLRLPPADRRRCAAELDRLRATLGEEQLAAELARGRAMPL